MSTANALTEHSTESLRSALAGDVFVPGEGGYDQARQAWNLFTDQRPAAVVLAGTAADVAQAVRFARAHRMRIAPQGTGHGSEPLEPLEGGRCCSRRRGCGTWKSTRPPAPPALRPAPNGGT